MNEQRVNTVHTHRHIETTMNVSMNEGMNKGLTLYTHTDT